MVIGHEDDLIIDYSSSGSKSPVSTSCTKVKKKAEENYKLVFKVAKNYLLDRLVAEKDLDPTSLKVNQNIF